MTFRLDQVVPWGRSFDEYVRMFSLSDADLEKRILGCGDGPSSFNAVMHHKAGQAVSVDPLYQRSARQIKQRIQGAFPTVMEQLIANQSAYVWKTIPSPEDLGRLRTEAMEVFLEDFEEGKAERRYLPHELPELPFEDGQFELALCSHLLFTYSEQLPAALHCQAMLEMCRVAGEVRVFPLLDMSGRPLFFLPYCHALPAHVEVAGDEFAASRASPFWTSGFISPSRPDLACRRLGFGPTSTLFQPGL